jgi:hypothetical protein
MTITFEAAKSARVGRFLIIALLAGAAQSALACNLGAWQGGNSGGVTVDAGKPTPDSVPRYSGLCGMATQSGTVGWVQDNSPGGISRIRARFYVLNNVQSGETALVYRGYDSANATNVLFSVFVNSGGNVTLIDGATGDRVSQAGATDWLSVEIDWQQGSGDGAISLSVNGQDAESSTGLANSGNPLESVRLGNLSGANSGNLLFNGAPLASPVTFDAYESRRTTAIGELCPGDADPAGTSADTRDFADISAIFTEFSTLGSELANGTPDANADGAVDFADISVVFDLFSNLQGACPNA